VYDLVLEVMELSAHSEQIILSDVDFIFRAPNFGDSTALMTILAIF